MKIYAGLIWIVRLFLNGAYSVLKILPSQKRVCFFSRQSDKITEDFQRLEDGLKARCPDVEIVSIFCRFGNLQNNLFRFGWSMLKSMYYLATSRVCVVDAYWPTVSMLRHKKSLKVIQIWHAMGKIKQSGYQTLDKASGRKADIAVAMCMHRNYDYVIGGGEAWNPYYCAAFDIEEGRILNYGLPRLDRILEQAEQEDRLRERHPELKGKTVILYAPTFREYEIIPPVKLMKALDPEKYEVIYRFHPRQRFADSTYAELPGYDNESTFDLLRTCDWLITDYSSLALEAAAINKKTVYYLYDFEKYCSENGVNINLFEIMPSCSFLQEDDIISMIIDGAYPQNELEQYKQRFLPAEMRTATDRIVTLIEACLDGKEICDNGRRRHDAVESRLQESEAFADR